MDLVREVQKNYRLPDKAKTIGELLAEARQKSGAMQRYETIMEQMKAAENVTEALKEQDQMAWVGAVYSISNRAEEIVLHEMIYI